jgi:predicted methyltransferase
VRSKKKMKKRDENDFMVMNGTPIYLRDFKEIDRAGLEREIRRDYPELVKALDQGDDIKIGVFLRKYVKA